MTAADCDHPLGAWLKKTGRTREQFALELGLSKGCVSRYIKGWRSPDAKTREAIACATANVNGEIEVPVSVWHQQDLQRAARKMPVQEQAAA